MMIRNSIKSPVILILVLIIILTGCTFKEFISYKSEKSKSMEPVHIKFWVWDNANNAQSQNVKRFNETHDKIKVDLEVVGWDNYHDELMAAISGGNGPDVFNLQVTWLPEFVEMNALEQMDDLIKDWPGRDDVFDSIWTPIKDSAGGKSYALPASAVVYYMYCRKDIFEKVGVPLPETISQFYDAAKRLTLDTNNDGKTDIYGFEMRGARMGNFMWMGLTFSDGPERISFFDSNGNVTLNNPQLIKASQRYMSIYKNGYAPKTAPKNGVIDIQQNFLSGASAMLVHHMASSKMMNDKFGDNLAVIPIPKGQSGRIVPMEMIVNGMLGSTRHKDEALEFLKWWTSTESNDFISRNMGQTPVLKSVTALPFYQQDKFAKVSVDSLAEAYLVPPATDMGQWIEVTWPEVFQKLLLELTTTEQFIKNISNGLKPIKR